MNIKYKKLAIPLVLLTTAAISACGREEPLSTNTEKPALVQKFSGGKLVFAGISTKPIQRSLPEGYTFVDKCSGVPVEVVGDLLVTYPDDAPSCDDVRRKIDGTILGLGFGSGH